MSKDADEHLISSIFDHLHSESGELVSIVPPGGLREMIANGLARARNHGIQAEEKLTAFISVMFEIAPNFDEHPAILAVLGATEGTPEERFDRIFTDLPASAWEEAEDSYDYEAWYPELRTTETEFRNIDDNGDPIP